MNNHSGTMQLFVAFYQGKRFGGTYTVKGKEKMNNLFLNLDWRSAN